MSNIKLKDHNWAAEGIYDTNQSKSQQTINSDVNTKIGQATLQTSSQNLSGATNELKGRADTLDAKADNLVTVSNTQPSSEYNKVWLPLTVGEGTQVPTWAEHQALSATVNEATAKSVQAIDYLTDFNDIAEYSPYFAAGRVKMFRVKLSTSNNPLANTWGLTEVMFANGGNQFVQYYYSSAGLWRRVAPGDNTFSDWIRIGDQHYHKGDTFTIVGGATLMAVVSASGTSGGATVILPKEIGSDVTSFTWTGSFNFFAEVNHPDGITGLTITGIQKTSNNSLGIAFSFPSGTTVIKRTFGFINPLNITITFN